MGYGYFEGSPQYEERLAFIEERVAAFLAHFTMSPAYDFDKQGEEALATAKGLSAVMVLYAMGGADTVAVETQTRKYIAARKRDTVAPLSQKPGQAQRNAQKYVNRVDRREAEEGKPAPPSVTLLGELQPEGYASPVDRLWRAGELLKEHKPTALGFFTEKPLAKGTLCYVMLAPTTVQSLYIQELRNLSPAIRVYVPSLLCSYYFKLSQEMVAAYQPAPNREAVERAWSKGWTSRK